MSPERLDTPDPQHLYRYEVARRYTEATDVVLDAACGTGYGRDILRGSWVGVDKHRVPGALQVDLETWTPMFGFDVFVGLETIEHLMDVSAYVDAAKQARRYVVISTPIIPTKHNNHFHLQDFTRNQINALFWDWDIDHYEEQDEIYGLFVFRRKS